MTTGNKSESSLISFADYYGGTSFFGKESYRIWSGTDYPSTRSLPTNSYYHGTKPPRKVWTRLPKRSYVSEHPYTVQAGTQVSSKITYNIVIPKPFPQPPEVTVVNLSSRFSTTNTTLWTSNDDNKLLDKLRDRLMGSDFNAGVSIAESSKSFGMIANSATKIALALKAVRSGRPGDAAIILTRNTNREGNFKPPRASRNTRSHVGGHWLELQYGWLPLLKDAEAGAKALAHAFSAPPQQIYRATRVVQDILTVAPQVGGKGEAYTLGTIKAIIREKNMPQLTGLMDPASIAWELLPYSFVVDWFIPIGGYLQNLALARGIEGTFVTSKFRYWRFNRSTFIGAPGFPTPQNVACSALLQGCHLTRTVSSSLTVPLPSWQPITKSLSARHCINAIALLTNLKFAKDSE